MVKSSDNQNNLLQGVKPTRKGWRMAALFCTFWFALLGWLRFYNGLRFTDNFTNLNLWPRPLYLTISGLVIGEIFSLGMLFLFLKARITPSYMKISGILFLIWLWFDNIWFGTREAFFNQLIVTLLITLVTMALIFVLVRKNDYYKENIND